MLDKQTTQAEEELSESARTEVHKYEKSVYIAYYNKGVVIEEIIFKWKNILRVRLPREKFPDHRRYVMIGEEKC